MRLFIAIELEPNIKYALTEIQGTMKKQNIIGNYTPIENVHLTLAFIGEYPDPEQVLETMEKVPYEPFESSLKGFGSFGNLWWAGLEKSDEIRNFIGEIDSYSRIDVTQSDGRSWNDDHIDNHQKK